MARFEKVGLDPEGSPSALLSDGAHRLCDDVVDIGWQCLQIPLRCERLENAIQKILYPQELRWCFADKKRVALSNLSPPHRKITRFRQIDVRRLIL